MIRHITLIIITVVAAGSLALYSIQNISADESNENYLPALLTSPILEPCWPTDTPAGALPNQPGPVFCLIVNSGPGTSSQEANRWLDEFDHGLSFANFDNTDYLVYETLEDVYDSIHWRHANHWMVDLAPGAPDDSPNHGKGGAMMRPNRSFQFENGKFIMEADLAAGHAAYGTEAWSELVISTGDQPEGFTPGSGLYAHDMFAGQWTLGCRLHAQRHPICALRDDSGDFAAQIASKRIWEMSWFQLVGTEVFGGNAFDGREEYWRTCAITDPDSLCRDRFRLELTRTSLTLYVNGIKYFQQSGIPPFPDAFIEGDLYTYFASVDVGHEADTIRYHWDRLAVNPKGPPSAAPGFEPPGT